MALQQIRLVRPAPDPLGLYLRVGHIGLRDLQHFISSGDGAFSGAVFNARRVVKQKELLSLALDVLGAFSQKRRDTTFSQHPKTRAAREVRR